MSGLAYAWGDNTYGQLGDNSETPSAIPISVSSAISWKQITGNGSRHVIAINRANGLAYAWGYNNYGQLGDKSNIARSVPTSVSSAISWKQISGGANHTVAIDGATGLAYAWGFNGAGQLGDNSTTNRSVPTSVSSTISWKQIAGGFAHTLAINGANGLAYAWGYNICGQLGDNSRTNRSVPTSVSSAISWKQIAGGEYHTVAIDGSNGLAYTWGYNNYGQLGDNSTTSRSVPISVSSAISWKEISCDYHTVAINGANGLAYAWGNNTVGQLGDNSTSDRSVPTSVFSAISWKQIACGYAHTTAINGANGRAYAWGDNTFGQLGDNSTTSRSVPTSVSSTKLWNQIIAGEYCTEAIEHEGTTYFGYCDSSGNPIGVNLGNDYLLSGEWEGYKNISFTCPGSGQQKVSELALYCYSASSSSLLIGIYDSNGDKVGEGSGTVSVTGSTAWYGHSSFSPSSILLTGGQNYRLFFSSVGSTIYMGYDDAASGISHYGTADYTGGFPATIPSGTLNIYIPSLRCGVNPAIGQEGTTVWGHQTGATEENKVSFADNWTGTGTIVGTGDTERIELSSGKYMESAPVSISGKVIIQKDKYGGSGKAVTIKYRTGTTIENCEAASYTEYTIPVQSTGYFQTKIEV